MDIQNFQKTILKGREIPQDLDMLINNKCAISILERDFFEFLTEEKLQKNLVHTLSEEDRNDPSIMANCKAIDAVFEKIIFFATIEARYGTHTLIGYWLENEDVSILDAPLVAYSEFDAYGDRTFSMLYDVNIIESLIGGLICVENEDEYEEYKKLFAKCGINLKEIWDLEAKTPQILPEELYAELSEKFKK